METLIFSTLSYENYSHREGEKIASLVIMMDYLTIRCCLPDSKNPACRKASKSQEPNSKTKIQIRAKNQNPNKYQEPKLK
jgi:hypothetical protein